MSSLQILRNRNFYLMVVLDAVLVCAAFVLSFNLRFDGSVPTQYMEVIVASLFWLVPLKLLIFYGFGLYHGMWRYTSIRDLRDVFFAVWFSTLALFAMFFMLHGITSLPRSIPVLDFILTLVFIGGVRVAVRMLLNRSGNVATLVSDKSKRVVILGAGQTGERMVREIRENPSLHLTSVGLFDDDPNKWSKSVHGCKVLGGIDHLGQGLVQFDEILIALPSVKGHRMREIVSLCKATEKPFRIIPNMAEIMDGTISVKSTRNVRFEDLLGRDEVKLDRELLFKRYAGKRVLVTGAGGSIGSELVSQIGHFKPDALGLLDFSEFNLFQIDNRARQLFSGLPIEAYLVDIRDQDALRRTMEVFRPHVILHAAAYKHVPLQEITPWEAVMNNVAGTRNMVQAALDYGVERFIMVSTDKAVRPTNVMGATKRVAELFTECANGRTGCHFSAVRFGNVLGSSGSVVPIFERQIAAGLPVTVTHPEVTRYFMSVSEAAQLILQAGAMAEGGEIYVLDMGQPVRIADMARDLIRMHGLEPEKDVPIHFVGLRPGEKLYEELITEGEGIVATRHERIRVIRGNHCDMTELDAGIIPLLHAAGNYDPEAIRSQLQRLVPEYRPAENVGESVKVQKWVGRVESGKMRKFDGVLVGQLGGGNVGKWEGVKVEQVKGRKVGDWGVKWSQNNGQRSKTGASVQEEREVRKEQASGTV